MARRSQDEITLFDVNDGEDGTNGVNGDPGAPAPRSTQITVYRGPLSSAPSTPTATSINFGTRALTGLTSGWQTTPVEVRITTTTLLYYQSVLTFTEDSLGGTQTVTASTPVASIRIGDDIQSDNFSSGTAGWQIQRDTGNAEFNDVTVRGDIISSNYNGSTNLSTSSTLADIGTEGYFFDSSSGILAAGNAIVRGIINDTQADIALFTASGTWTKPAGIRSFEVTVVGGGGGGGTADTNSVGQDGGAGGFIVTNQPVASTTYTITVGAGGASGTTIGGNGGFSRFQITAGVPGSTEGLSLRGGGGLGAGNAGPFPVGGISADSGTDISFIQIIPSTRFYRARDTSGKDNIIEAGEGGNSHSTFPEAGVSGIVLVRW